VARALAIVLLPALLSLAVSCAQHQTVSRDELHADLVSTTSIAAEAALSIDMVSRGQVTRNFAVGHFLYLANQLDDSAKEIDGSLPAAGLEQRLKDSRVQVHALSAELRAVVSEVGNPDALRASQQRLDAIRQTLAKENASR
jgi:hypothetical protein